MTRQRLGIVSAGLLALAAPASGWGQCGHRVVGTLADDRLDPAVAGEVRHLLGGETLAMVSTWADEVRNDPRYHRGTWHYTSIPDGATWGDAPRSEEGEEDLVQAILLNARILADRARSRRDRGVALRWLAHLVGDLHQPLHVGRASDRGGNTIVCRWTTEFGGLPRLVGPGEEGDPPLEERAAALVERAEALEAEGAAPEATRAALADAVALLREVADREVVGAANLHAIWDTHLIEMKGLDYREYARFIVARRGTAAEPAWAAFTADEVEAAVLTWTQESLELRGEVYERPPAHRYGHYQYRDAKLPLVERRLHEAGVRLARLVNVLLRPAEEGDGDAEER